MSRCPISFATSRCPDAQYLIPPVSHFTFEVEEADEYCRQLVDAVEVERKASFIRAFEYSVVFKAGIGILEAMPGREMRAEQKATQGT